MTALAMPAENSHRDAIRWSVCFALVIAAHGGAALAPCALRLRIPISTPAPPW